MNHETLVATDLDGATVNQIAWRYPTTVEVFNRFGVDMCCGGSVTLAVAAVRDGIDKDELATAVRAAIGVER